MNSGSYDFNGYQVLVVGGTRGEGHRIASPSRPPAHQ